MTLPTKMTPSLISLASNIDPVRGGRHAAVVTYKNNPVAYGTNKLKSHPIQAKYATNPEAIFLHAEIDAIIQATRVLTPEEFHSTNTSLLVLRVKFNPTKTKMSLAMSKPCNTCQTCILDFGIPNVYYTNKEGLWVNL